MKKFLILLVLVAILAACRAPGRPIPVTTFPARATAVLPTPTPNGNFVEVTRLVTEQLEPTATPAPCTPLLEGMRLTISMAEQARTILLDAEGLLPEDKPIVLLNVRSPNHSSAIELTLANPVGPDGRYQDTFHLGENDIANWCIIRAKTITNYGGCRSPITAQNDHSFRPMPIISAATGHRQGRTLDKLK